MKVYTRSLIVVIMIITLITLYAAASQGWWVVSFRNAEIIEYHQEQRAHTGTTGYYGRGKPRRFRSRSNRSFRGGSRRGGK